MEPLNIHFAQDGKFDELVHNSLPQASPVTVAFKDAATVSGKPGAVIAFDVSLPDGTITRVQATVTARLLQTLGAAITGRYGRI